MTALMDLKAYLRETFKDLDISLMRGELRVNAGLDQLEPLVKHLKDGPKCAFHQLVDICGVDYPERTPRFDMVYHFLSHTHNTRLRLVVSVDGEARVPSLTPHYSGADWFEREVYDMYGVSFKGHPNLRRILTDYSFEGHPLRKDFPLSGFSEVYYSKEKNCVDFRPVTLEDPYRDFDFESSWKGVKTVLNGREGS